MVETPDPKITISPEQNWRQLRNKLINIEKLPYINPMGNLYYNPEQWIGLSATCDKLSIERLKLY